VKEESTSDSRRRGAQAIENGVPWAASRRRRCTGGGWISLSRGADWLQSQLYMQMHAARGSDILHRKMTKKKNWRNLLMANAIANNQ